MLDLRSFTDHEVLRVVDRAIDLIRTPATWCQGHWKCATTGPKGKTVYQYCIQGAVNQALIDEFGEARATAAGVYIKDEQPKGDDPVAIFSIDGMANDLFGASDALGFNDSSYDYIAERLAEDEKGANLYSLPYSTQEALMERARVKHHGDVLRILIKKAEQLRKAITA